MPDMSALTQKAISCRKWINGGYAVTLVVEPATA
jgi:hypothetical protein